MPNYSGGNTLRDLIGLVKDKFDYLKGLIDGKQHPFPVTCTLDFMNNTVNDMSATFSEIKEAYKRGDHVFLDCDIGEAAPGARLQANLALLALSGTEVAIMSFEGTAAMDGFTLFVAIRVADGMSSFTYDNILLESAAISYIDTRLNYFTDNRNIERYVVAYLYTSREDIGISDAYPYYDIENKLIYQYDSNFGDILTSSIDKYTIYLVMNNDGSAKLFYGDRQIKT